LEVLNNPEAIKKYDTLVFDTLGKCIDRICDYVGNLSEAIDICPCINGKLDYKQ
jgi:hypothetical protein